MNLLPILLVTLQILHVEPTILEKFVNKAREHEDEYSQLIEITTKIINQNTIDSSSNYVAIIGLNDEFYVSDEILKKISTAVASPSEIHGLARNIIIFMHNFNEILMKKNLDKIYEKGRMIICCTNLYSEEIEFFKDYTKSVSYFWRNRFSQIIFICWIKNEVKIYGIRLYDEEKCVPTELIEFGKVKNGKIVKDKEFYEKVRNLNKCTLRITTTTGMPYAETFVVNNVTKVKGIEGNILNILSKRMNFTTLISDTNKLLTFDSRFNDSKDILRSNDTDLIFAGKKVNIDRIEPTVSIMDCQKIWIVPKAEMLPPWMQVIIPFEKSVWILVIFTLSFVGVICLILNKKIASLMNMYSLFLGVGIPMKKAPENKFVKMLLGTWIIFSYVITRSYLAALEGYLTKPSFLPEINTLKELVDLDIPIEGHPIVEKLFCRENELTSLMSRKICNRFEAKSTESLFENIKLKGKLESAFTMKAAIYKNSKFLRDYETHTMEEILLKYPTAFLAQRGAPFLDEMNFIITRLIESGFIDLWQRENILIQEKRKHYPEKLRVEHISGIMLVTTLGYAISIGVFCIECLLNYFNFSAPGF